MPHTVEDAVDWMFTKEMRKFVDMKELSVLSDIRIKTWYQNIGLTAKQRGFVIQIVVKYLVFLQMTNFPVDDLLDPTWKTPLRPPIVSTKALVDFNGIDFGLTFPFQTDIVRLIQHIRNTDGAFLCNANWDPGTKTWHISNTFQGRRLIRYLISLQDWDLTDDAKIRLDNEPMVFPTVIFDDGLRLVNGSKSLQTHFDIAITAPQTFLQTIHELNSFGLEFDESVREKLRSELSEEQIGFLCDKTVQLVSGRPVEKFKELVTKIDKWPVVLENFSVTVMNDEIWKQLFDEWIFGTATSAAKVEPRTVPTIYHVKLNKNAPVDFPVRVPWLIAYSGFIRSFSPGDFLDRIKHINYTKYVVLS